MFELKILLCNVLVPSLVAVVGVAIGLWRLRATSTGTNDESNGEPNSVSDSTKPRSTSEQFDRIGFMAGGLSAVLGIWLAFSLRNDFQPWAEDSWLRIPLGTSIVGVTALLASSLGRYAWQVPAILAGIAASQLVFPTGENWADLADQRIYWSGLLSAAPAVAWLLIPKQNRLAGAMSLGWIVCVAALAFLTAQSFMRVTEPLLAVASIFGVFGIAALAFNLRSSLQGAVTPTLFAMAAAGSNAQFNSFLGLPNTLTALAISTPAIAALVFRLCSLRTRAGSARSRALNLVVIVVSCILLAAAVVIWTLMLAGTGEEEW